jgi:hypothetical protein
MTDSASLQIQSAVRGPHWIAWVSRPGTQEPEGAVVVVGETQVEAEARAREWLASRYRVTP